MNWSDVLQVLASAAMTAFAGYAFRVLRHNLELFRVLQSAQKALLKDRILSLHAAAVAQGKIDPYCLATAEELYAAYHSLGGNGFVETLMTDIRGLAVTA